jgi:signal transduction histidine kinase
LTRDLSPIAQRSARKSPGYFRLLQHFETIRQTKDGRLIPISLTVSPIKADDGTIIGASKIARDISEQVKAREEISMLNARKDEFIGIAGHELRTPITTIKGYLQLMEEQAETAVARSIPVIRST